MAETAKIDYGLDAPRLVKNMFVRAGWTFVFAVALFVMNRAEYPAPALNLLIVLGLLAAGFAAVGWVMVWSSRVAKLGVRDRIIESLQLKGDEKVLDAGCGKGLMAIGIAKRLKTGRVTAVDVWNPFLLSGNSIDAAKENAKLEGVAEKVRFEAGDIPKLTYPEGNFDVAVSSLAIHNLAERTERDASVREMLRVLKPDGRLLIFDVFRTAEYAETLAAAGAKDVTLSERTFLWCVPTRSVSARK